MASLASSAVTILSSWCEGDITGKRLRCAQVTAVLTGQGGTTNTIPATAFGYTKIITCSNMVKSDSTKMWRAAPSVDGTIIVIEDPTVTTGAVADVTSQTVTFVIKGQ